MSIKYDESLKPLATGMAKSLGAETGTRYLSLFKKAMAKTSLPSSLEAFPVNSSQVGSGSIISKPIGIGPWIARDEVFVLDPMKRNQWHQWASIESFPQKKVAGKKRIVMLGESVARAFLYDPVVTVANCIEANLNQDELEMQFEVIDLAKTDLVLNELISLVEEIPTIQPDLVVIFAGNNWSVSLGDLDEDYLCQVLRDGHSLGEVSDLCRQILKQQIERYGECLATLVNRYDIQVLHVIPEFNLFNWKSPQSLKQPPFLRGINNQLWEEKLNELNLARRAEDKELSIKLANQLIELDENCTAIGHEVLAEVEFGCGDIEKAVQHMRNAQNSYRIHPEVCTPGCNQMIQEALRVQLEKNDIPFVDLPNLMSSSIHSSKSTKDYFIDYCHLSLSGIELVVGEICDSILKSFRSGGELKNKISPSISTYDNGLVAFLAAIHNAHWGQPDCIVSEYLNNAPKLSPEVIQVMKLFLDFKSKSVPDEVTESFHRFRSSGPHIEKHFQILFRNKGFNESRLISLIVEAIRNFEKPQSVSLESASAEIDIQFIPRTQTLVQKSHFLSSYAQLEGQAVHTDPPMYFQSYQRSSSFSFLSRKNRAVNIEAVLRVPIEKGQTAEVQFELNGELLLNAQVGPIWEKIIIELPKIRLESGSNIFKILWPLANQVSLNKMAARIQNLEIGIFEPFYPIFGEVHQLDVKQEEV